MGDIDWWQRIGCQDVIPSYTLLVGCLPSLVSSCYPFFISDVICQTQPQSYPSKQSKPHHSCKCRTVTFAEKQTTKSQQRCLWRDKEHNSDFYWTYYRWQGLSCHLRLSGIKSWFRLFHYSPKQLGRVSSDMKHLTSDLKYSSVQLNRQLLLCKANKCFKQKTLLCWPCYVKALCRVELKLRTS